MELEYTYVLSIISLVIVFFVIIYTYNTYDYRISNKDYSKVKSIKNKIFSKRKKNNQKNVSISFNTHKKSRKLISNDKKKALRPPQFKINFNQDEKDIIYIFSKANEKYTINELEKFFQKNSYFLNSMGVYEKIDPSDSKKGRMYLVTDMNEPGYLEKKRTIKKDINGLCFILKLPINICPSYAFENMINDARTISKKYNGNVLNENMILLSKEDEESIKNDIISINENS